MEDEMIREALISAAGLMTAALIASGSASAAQYATAGEAKAMLERAVVEVTADKAAALGKFNDPKGAFRDRDLYVFCANASDGVLTAHPKLVGTDLRTIKDKNGKPFGREMFEAAKSGEIAEVAYMWPRPEGGDPVEKNSYVTRVADQICGVGYYK
jgi:hypothetical protein